MSLTGPQTPQKQYPGAFVNTPAPNRSAPNAGALQQYTGAQNTGQDGQPPRQDGAQAQGSSNSTATGGAPKGLSMIERAARTLNATFEDEARYPALDNYISRECPWVYCRIYHTEACQRAIRPTTIYRRPQLSRLFRKSKPTTFRTRSLNNTTKHRCRR